MTRDKELLLKDLCARLPHGVKIEVTYSKDSGSSFRAGHCCEGINTLDTNIVWLFQQSEIYIKPCLFPLSSMTKEHIFEINDILGGDFEIDRYSISDTIRNRRTSLSYLELNALFEYFNKNHFDYQGLIPMGLANDATGLDVY